MLTSALLSAVAMATKNRSLQFQTYFCFVHPPTHTDTCAFPSVHSVLRQNTVKEKAAVSSRPASDNLRVDNKRR